MKDFHERVLVTGGTGFIGSHLSERLLAAGCESILLLARLVLQLTGSSVSPVFLKLPGDDPKQRQPDITLARTQLAPEPQVSPDEGLTRTIDYLVEVL